MVINSTSSANLEGTRCKCVEEPCPCSCHGDKLVTRSAAETDVKYSRSRTEYECTNCGWEESVATKTSGRKSPWRLTRRNTAYVIIGMMMVWLYVVVSNQAMESARAKLAADNIDRVVIMPFLKPMFRRFQAFLQHRTRVIGGDVNWPYCK